MDLEDDHLLQGTISRKRCCLCGSAILGEFEMPLWMCQFHTVYATDTDANAKAYLSTSGRRRGSSDVINIELSDRKIHNNKRTLEVNLIPYALTNFSQNSFLVDIGPDAWGYPFHSACWKLLTNYRCVDQEDLQSLLNLCRSQPIQAGMLNFGHEYGGRARFDLAVAPGEENFLTSSPIVLGMDVNPCNIVELWQIFDSSAHDAPEPPRHEMPKIEPFAKIYQPDTFAVLPTDILLALVDHLTLPELSLVKQASRTFANLELPNWFWKRRFLPGREFDYIFEAQDYSGGNWESICKAINAAKSNGTVRYTLHLRRHIWNLCTPLDQTLRVMRQVGCEGNPVRSAYEQDAPPEEISWVTVGRTEKSPAQLRARGSRIIYERVLEVPAETCTIYASTVKVFGVSYISGLRIQDDTGRSRLLGFQHPQDETVLAEGKGGMRILGFDVALDQRGVRGLALVLHTGGKSSWVGDFKNVPKRMLRSYSCRSEVVSLLKGKFDATKLVAFSVNDAAPIDESALYHERRMPKLWYPDLPEFGLSFPGSNKALSQSNRSDSAIDQDLPLCFKLFGGSNPERLTEIKVRHRIHEEDMLKIESVSMKSTDDKEHAELGFRRTDDRYSKYYDLNHEHEESLVIDGPGGERVESVKTWWLEERLVGFTLDTNRDRSATFVGGLDVDKHKEIRMSVTHAEERKVVGFWATMETEAGFVDFGLVLR
ncbi:hypothetical protein BKA59DRAFT_478748 [Fusarium tricinctum]|uniref:F-box domain-containing protein n=1 Tax=Fusarium tricinctum TaxID=61284 RepID=A0A8K0RQB6_9HYPO|nr:hypothetical protein BKA59DRAFT_478748 [Fusarium tricinctum]